MNTSNPNDSVAGFRLGPDKTKSNKQPAQPGNIPLRDMFELASLDAMGLLEDHERKAFDETFSRLNPSVQAQLRQQQSRIADLAGTLPQVEPPAALRQRVIDAVSTEIDNANRSAGRIAPDILPSRGVSAFWRVAAIGCAAAAIVFGFTTLQMGSHINDLTNGLRNNAVADLFIKEFGPKFENALMDNKTQFIQFASATGAKQGDPEGQPMAVILLDSKSGTAQLFCKDLPNRSGVYNLVVVDASGKASDVLLSFRAAGGSRISDQINRLELSKGVSLQISHADGEREAVLKSTNL